MLPHLPHNRVDPPPSDPNRVPASELAPVLMPPPGHGVQLGAFLREFAAATGLALDTPDAVQTASVAQLRVFWRCFAQWAGQPLGWSGSLDPVCEGDAVETARFFPALRLNYAASLLSPATAPDEAIALTECRWDGTTRRWTRAALRTQVARLAHALSQLGIGDGDRVVAVLRHDASAVIAALAAAAVGATVSTASPEMGLQALAERFAPLGPRLLIAHGACRPFDASEPLPAKLCALALQLPDLRWLVRLDGDPVPGPWQQWALEELAAQGDALRFGWPSFAFNHPLFIMFSSGTTGRPKCIVHGAGGSLIEHLKEHRLHTGLQHGDRLYFHTSCSWMMWNWQLSALASGVEIVTWDGPVASATTLWQLIARERVTVFGTSPAYLRLSQEAGVAPARQFDLSALRAILSTGAVLYDAQFDWVREQVGTLPLQSISGGTDILGCFLLGHPQLPVRRGELQARSLGLDVQSWQAGGPSPGVGQLVCAHPFPSRPLGFFRDVDGAAFHAAYFAANPGVWTHGDLVEFTPSGGARLHGRCDGMFNVRGIKVMPAEICRVLQDEPAVRDSMVVDLAGEPTRMVALLVLREDTLGAFHAAGLAGRLRRQIARRLSPAHVPDHYIVVPALPMTHSGKLSDAAARCAINDLPITNLAALRNPDCLAALRDGILQAKMQRDGQRGAQALPATPDATGAASSLEAQLQALWQQQLAVPQVGLDDHFLELGGNSLQAAVIMTRVQQMTGRSLPLGSLLQASTVRALAGLVRASQTDSAASPVVTLREGVGPPLVLVHGLSGTVMECWSLVDALRTRRPVLGLQARGLDGEAAPHDLVQAMAADYVEALARHAPRGHYALCGFSFGGLVALEMARRLTQSGCPVDLLCLLDSHLCRNLPPVLRLWHRCLHVAVKLRLLSPADRRAYLARMLDRLRHAVAGQPDTTAATVLAHGGLSAPHRQVMQALRRALTAYRPAPYDAGPVLFVRARVPLDGYLNPLPQWRQVLRGGLQVVRVPGSHLELVKGNGPRVAALIDQALESLQGRDAGDGDVEVPFLSGIRPAGGSS